MFTLKRRLCLLGLLITFNGGYLMTAAAQELPLLPFISSSAEQNSPTNLNQSDSVESYKGSPVISSTNHTVTSQQAAHSQKEVLSDSADQIQDKQQIQSLFRGFVIQQPQS